ncbi:MAG TPA: gamma-glutamylcyclotransferase family protein [Gammaproteobacteria bacterium]|nr:gamma-glutamylcyclotransferase family protein [Gammaproteobacteria bacterium]
MRDSLLFVYGTLRPCVDIRMSRWLRRNARYLGGATTAGRLYDLGPYPAMRAAGVCHDRVIGDVYRVVQRRVLSVLDRYEAGEVRRRPRFVRERCIVKLARGANRTAWTYRYRYSVAGAPRIVGGDYREHRR